MLLVVSTTPLPVLLRGLEMTGAPRFLLMVAQFLYRYLFVISEEAQHMSKAAASRGASVGGMAGQRRPIPRRGGRPGGAIRALLRTRRRHSSRHAGARISGVTFSRCSRSGSATSDAAFCSAGVAGAGSPAHGHESVASDVAR